MSNLKSCFNERLANVWRSAVEDTEMRQTSVHASLANVWRLAVEGIEARQDISVHALVENRTYNTCDQYDKNVSSLKTACTPFSGCLPAGATRNLRRWEEGRGPRGAGSTNGTQLVCDLIKRQCK